MKVYVIIMDEVYGFENYVHTPEAYLNKETALKALDDWKDDLKADYADELEDGWVYEDGEMYCEVYEDGNYSENHYTIYLKEVEVCED